MKTLEQKRAKYRRDAQIWRAKNPDKVKASAKRYRDEHKEEICAKKREIYAADPQKMRQRNKTNRTPEKSLLYSARRRAKERDIPFSITEEDIFIPEFCPLLGMPLVTTHSRHQDDSPSLDRIEPHKGYVRGNVWVISCRANRIKNDATIQELAKIVNALGCGPLQGEVTCL